MADAEPLEAAGPGSDLQTSTGVRQEWNESLRGLQGRPAEPKPWARQQPETRVSSPVRSRNRTGAPFHRTRTRVQRRVVCPDASQASGWLTHGGGSRKPIHPRTGPLLSPSRGPKQRRLPVTEQVDRVAKGKTDEPDSRLNWSSPQASSAPQRSRVDFQVQHATPQANCRAHERSG